MESGAGDEVLNDFAKVADQHLEKIEREAAWDLIREAFGALPWELQDLYSTYVETYNAGQREQASKLFEMWMDQARKLGLI
jgi:uncharacterized tellurite resistance protein B-like protein